MRKLIIGQPAIVMTLVATIIRLCVSHFVNTTPTEQAWVNAVVTAGAGLIVAVWVKHNGQVPALLGFVQAVIAVGVGFGFHISADQQAAIMSIIGGAASLFVWKSVIAPASNTPVPAAID